MPEIDRFVLSLKEKKTDLVRMKEAASHFVGEHDFSAFSASRGEEEKEDSKIRKVWKMDVFEGRSGVHFLVEGSGFLYKMVEVWWVLCLMWELGKLNQKRF